MNVAFEKNERAVMENICPEDQDTIREFLVESHENLERLDQDLVELEKHPHDSALLSSVFRIIHTIKGACGFLAFSNLERITHEAETLLSQLRDGKRELTPTLVSLILETVDATRRVLTSIEATGREGELVFEELTGRLRLAAQLSTGKEKEPNPSQAVAEASQTTTPEIAAPDQDTASVGEVILIEPQKKIPYDRKAPAPGVHASKATSESVEEDDCSRSSSAVDANIRVGVGLLDKLMDLVGELVLTRNQILQFNAEREDATLNATSQRLNLITSELQEGVMKTRMQPIGVVWHSLPRVVRDMAVSMGKQIQLKMDGVDTELDRTIIEAIKDPLIHLVRNSCDHGIESPEARVALGKPAQGTMTLRAYHEGGQVSIEVGDDGAGIDVARVKAKAVEKGFMRAEQAAKLGDREALNLIFEPGFSTAQTVTNLSGRGVGMDVVKSNVERIGGIVDIFSRVGEGTTIKIRIPLTLAIIPGLVITTGGERFVIPQISLLELIRLESDSTGKHIEYVHGTPVYRRRGSLLPVTYLNQVLGLKSTDQAEVSMVVLQADDQQFGMVVDGINDTQEIVVKPLGKQLKGLTLYAGATIMGDGHVALILDVLGIGQRSGVLGESREQTHVADKPKAQAVVEQQRLLLFQAGSFERLAIPLSLVARLEEFPQSTIEHAGSGLVVQYREHILSLVSLRAVLEPGASDREPKSDPIQVVVFNDGDRSVGMVVDQILDVVEETVTVRQKSTRKGLLGSAVVGKRVTDFLDLNAVIEAARESWFHSSGDSGKSRIILVADRSPFTRNLIRTGLDMAGHAVLEASNPGEALQALEQHPVDLVVATIDLLSDDNSKLATALRRRSELKRIPVLAMAESAEQARAFDYNAAGFQDCQAKYDTTAALESISRLVFSGESVDPELACTGEKR
jgi:two-component system chemotaxis sensor kinase CheA